MSLNNPSSFGKHFGFFRFGTLIAFIFAAWLLFSSYDEAGNGTTFIQGRPVPNTKITNAICLSKTSLKLEWLPKNNIDGYILVIKDKDGETLKRKKIDGANVTSCVVDHMMYRKVYRFNIACYRKRITDIKKGEFASEDYRTKLKVTDRYEHGYKYFYDWDGNRLTDTLEFVNDKSDFEIRTNIKACVTTVYAKDGDRGYTIPVKVWLSSPSGSNTVPGVWQLGAKYRYRPLFYGTNSQWAVRIHDEILFHTTPYNNYGDNNSLDPAEYNKLGTAASHGCIRMQCEAVKWIFDNCDNKTTVVIYEDDNPGALGKPELEEIEDWHTWDPTDPTATDLCKERGCHQIPVISVK